jgi:hypothetical protein
VEVEALLIKGKHATTHNPFLCYSSAVPKVKARKSHRRSCQAFLFAAETINLFAGLVSRSKCMELLRRSIRLLLFFFARSG